MKNICVFCGSNPGSNPDYMEGAKKLGIALAEAGITLVYGGARVGLMGAVADTVLAHGGEVIGVIPKSLVDREIAHTGLTDLHIVGSMHERKALMSELADGFIALPGGSGTLEEFFEVFTWAQLGHHQKPCGLLNLNGYFTPLLQFIDHTIGEGFMKEDYRAMILSDSEPEPLLQRFEQYQAPEIVKWVDHRPSTLSKES
ncbi:cytokinin riboside 5'-monophosphate phosphoribohydrolase [Kroppenstedtia guangzhouensis]|uniref:Cytokinin riboside 5'-monophosphate phosphoribohydrolase n=1 Tax=Kroppenstedtia guangzhouensis TaxID=1274356 RepID=A0ABQ1GZN5_9BACL|nr:TIGR00730 family Rossman fold protein [Kroppenstedtia guangzhouensis]GGA52974.1 cytokinin riboside 5'-monophosphate phosphoribohydrolase [Kroppenstedtia guangzhouensis]